jgi:molecular chaperone DnaJ
MDPKKAFSILKIPFGSSQEEIKKAWRQLSRKFHPDISHEHRDGEAFREIYEAYEFLKKTPQAAMSHSVSKAPFEIKCTLEQVVRQESIEIEGGACTTCHGSGKVPIYPTHCVHCAGTGQVRVRVGQMTSFKTCEHCGGTGQKTEDTCPSCLGTGRGPDIFLLPLPPHVWDGSVFHYKGRAFKPIVSFPDNLKLDGNTLLLRAFPPYPLFILGGNFELVLPWGETTTIKIPEGTKSGTVLRFENIGLPLKNGQRGDIKVWLAPNIPPKNDEVISWLQGWKKEWNKNDF